MPGRTSDHLAAVKKFIMTNNENRSSTAERDTDRNKNQDGRSQGRENNPGNFANDREKASEAGRKGGQN